MRLDLRILADSRVSDDDADQLKLAVEDWAHCAGVATGDVTLARQPLLTPFPATTGDLPASAFGSEAHAVNLLIRPLAEFLSRYAPRDRPPTVTVLPDLAPPSSAAAVVLPEAVGLGIPATGVAAEFPEWWSLLPAPRSPLVMLSALHLRPMSRTQRANAVGHEIGHALGLRHDARACNLMGPAQNCGVGWLDASQVAQVREQIHEAATATRSR